ncbi:Uncharacterised protein [uncultured archaeon]|nr:Uncharacterised protein [uncultured archaeon]
MARKRSKKRWIQRALHKHKKGALHRQLGIPEGETIPISLLRDASKEPGLLGQRARFALNVRKIRGSATTPKRRKH